MRRRRVPGERFPRQIGCGRRWRIQRVAWDTGMSKRSQFGEERYFSGKRQGHKEKLRAVGIFGALPGTTGFVERGVQVVAFCSGWTPKMGSFGNLVSVRSFPPGLATTQRGANHRIQRRFWVRNGNSFIINGKNLKLRVTDCRLEPCFALGSIPFDIVWRVRFPARVS